MGGSVTYGRFNQQILSIEHTHGLQMDVMLNIQFRIILIKIIIFFIFFNFSVYYPFLCRHSTRLTHQTPDILKTFTMYGYDNDKQAKLIEWI